MSQMRELHLIVHSCVLFVVIFTYLLLGELYSLHQTFYLSATINHESIFLQLAWNFSKIITFDLIWWPEHFIDDKLTPLVFTYTKKFLSCKYFRLCKVMCLCTFLYLFIYIMRLKKNFMVCIIFALLVRNGRSAFFIYFFSNFSSFFPLISAKSHWWCLV